MTIRSSQYVACGQIALGLSLFICLLINPHYFFATNQGGVSNYGTYDQTRTLFILGFGAAAIGTFMGSIKLPKVSVKMNRLKMGMYLLSSLYLLVMATTFSYKTGGLNKEFHLWAALVLFLVMLYLSIWIRQKTSAGKRLRNAFIIFCIGSLIGALTAFEIIHLLFTAQVISGVSFGYMLTRIVRICETKNV
ncbi:MAG: hypothetical protein ACR2FM_03840 [Candidatus Saccharimonadales bacterium]